MDRSMLKRALEQSLNTGTTDEETEKALDNLAESILQHLNEEKSGTNFIVAEAFRSGGINALETLYQSVLSDSRTTFKQQDIKHLINDEVKKLK